MQIWQGVNIFPIKPRPHFPKLSSPAFFFCGPAWFHSYLISKWSSKATNSLWTQYWTNHSAPWVPTNLGMRWHVNLGNLCAFQLKFCFCFLPSMVYVHTVLCGGDVEPERRGGQCSWGGRGFGVGREVRASPATVSVFRLYWLCWKKKEWNKPKFSFTFRLFYSNLKKEKPDFEPCFWPFMGCLNLDTWRVTVTSFLSHSQGYWEDV